MLTVNPFMSRRIFDVLFAATALLVFSPILLLSAVGVRVCSPGPIIYRAKRAGRGGRTFVMYKIRTMHAAPQQGSVIAGHGDVRVYPLGKLLRATKIDELPQLWNVLRGEMSIVGPRPEDPSIVEQHYDALGMQSLEVKPGLASAGSVYGTTHMHLMGTDVDPETAYLRDLLPVKLAMEVVSIRKQSLIGDLRIIVRTILTIAQIAAGRRSFDDPPELPEAERLLREHQHSRASTDIRSAA